MDGMSQEKLIKEFNQVIGDRKFSTALDRQNQLDELHRVYRKRELEKLDDKKQRPGKRQCILSQQLMHSR
ncbi:MAG: hypothetical protein K6E91_05950 [Butyrivibrio sp.]|nr:hypothetical protein [Butyrivibrio sp.]